MTASCLTAHARGPLLMAVLTAAWLTVVALVALHRPPWGDEVHYVDTVRTLSYMHWEKYFMPLLPLAGVLLLAMREDRPPEAAEPATA